MKWVLVAALVVVCASASASAQSTGAVAGSIDDQTGAALSGVRMTIRGATNGETLTSAAGSFSFQDLPPGDYEITAELTGFERAHATVRVHAATRTGVSFTLHVAMIEETIVTAAKGGERDLQTIPLSITAIDSAALERLGSQTLEDIPALAPSVTLSQNVGYAQLTIRGIGSTTLFTGGDPSSAMYLDGVYLARPAMAFAQLLDVDRIEVLRGPQGTLYGRNAVGGALNLIPRPPTNDFQASAAITGGNFSEFRADARVSGPLKRDRVMGSIAFARGVRDGYVRDLEHPDHPLGGDDITATRGQMRVVFDRRTSLLLSGDLDVQAGTPLTYAKVLAMKPGFTADNPSDLHDVRASVMATTHTQQSGASARLTTALTPATTLVSLTAYRALGYDFVVDGDSTELDLLSARSRERQHQLSEEITISHRQPRLNWVAGAFLFDETDRLAIRLDQPPTRLQTQLDPRVDASSRAVFGQATVALTARLSATAGMRYTNESKDIDNAGGRYSLDAPSPPIAGSVYGYTDAIVHGAWTPKVSVDMKLPHDALGYVSATRGFKSGGFNISSTVPGRGYAPEFAWNYEAGWKAVLPGGRSRLNISAFTMDYTDLQVQTPIAVGVFDIRNAAAAMIHGVEVENTSRIGHGLEAGGHVTWLDARYDHYTAVNNLNVTGDVSGNRLNNAPEWAGRIWIEWRGNLGRARRLSLGADATAQSTVYYTPFNDNIQFQGPYGLLGTRLEYGPRDRRWALSVYGRNLTDTGFITATFGTSPAAYGGRPGAPRQLAMEFSVRR